MLTPIQSRMARAALGRSLRDVAKALQCSHTSIAYFEQGQSRRISIEFIDQLTRWYCAQGIVFGPASGVAIHQNVFATERALTLALWRILQAHGILPTSTELLAALREAKDVSPIVRAKKSHDD